MWRMGVFGIAVLAAAPAQAGSLADALRKGIDVAGIQSLIAADPKSVNKPGKYGYTALHLAASGGDIKLMRVLLKHGADVHAQQSDVGSPLQLAAERGHQEAVALLIRHKAAVNEVHGYSKWTPLGRAARKGHAETIDLLLEAGADVNRGRTLACAIQAGQIDTARRFILRGAKVDRAEVISSAAQHGTPEFMALVLRRGGGVIRLEKMLNLSMIGEAAHRRQWQVATMLLEAGAKPRGVYQAAVQDHGRLIRLLAEHGADLDKKSYEGIPPIDVAAVMGNQSSLAALSASGAQLTPAAVVALGRLDALKDLLAADPAVLQWQSPNYQYSALHVAAIHDQSRAAEMLIAAGAKVDRGDRANFTALHIAAKFGHPTVATVLLRHGADVQARSQAGMYGFGLATPLHTATKPFRKITPGHVEVARLLLARGADVTVKGEQFTPLQLAQQSEHKPMTQLLKAAEEKQRAAAGPQRQPHSDSGHSDTELGRDCLGT